MSERRASASSEEYFASDELLSVTALDVGVDEEKEKRGFERITEKLYDAKFRGGQLSEG